MMTRFQTLLSISICAATQRALVDGPLLGAADFPDAAAHALHVATLASRRLYIPPRTLTAGQVGGV
jgi:hypothetical protein